VKRTSFKGGEIVNGGAQWGWCILLVVDLLLSAHFHGKPRKSYNFWIAALNWVILTAIVWWGGFFD
jgi:hypothetical protein